MAVAGGSEPVAGAGSWHPDPHGRAHVRLAVDGAWTDRVATWGEEWVDPPGCAPGQVDASLLAEPTLVLSFLATSLAHPGSWPIYDGAGQPKGEVVVERTTGLRTSHDARYLFLNPAREVVLAVDPPAHGVGVTLGKGKVSHQIPVLDRLGQLHGTCSALPFDSRSTFRVGDAVVGSAPTHVEKGAQVGGVGVNERVDHQVVPLVDLGGATFATVVRHERVHTQHGQDRGWSYGVADPQASHFELHRPAGLAEPMRSFALAFPAVLGYILSRKNPR